MRLNLIPRFLAKPQRNKDSKQHILIEVWKFLDKILWIKKESH